MSGFLRWLEKASASDSKVRAVLRRSLSFPPGAFVPAYPYVEPFIHETGHGWRREAHYLLAGLWAAHWREGRAEPPVPIGKACAVHLLATRQSSQRNGPAETGTAQLPSTERRFINLLDADTDQLPHRLRQMIALLKDQPIDFDALLDGLTDWNDDQKRTQTRWARDFYRSLDPKTEGDQATSEEVTL